MTVDWLQGVLLVSLFRQPGEVELAELRQMLLALTREPVWQHSGARPCSCSTATCPTARPSSCGESPSTAARSSKTACAIGWISRASRTAACSSTCASDVAGCASAAGLRVLNLFAYTCGFSVAAIAGGAARVVNLDMSRPALSRGRDNHRLNGHDLAQVSFWATTCSTPGASCAVRGLSI